MNGSGDGETDSGPTTNRRTVLRMLGAGAAAFAAAPPASTAAAAEDYETVTVPAGGSRTYDLGSGDSLENVLVDVTADGADLHVSASGDDWAIRNVGVRGAFDVGDDSTADDPACTGGFSQVVHAQGNGTIENVYLGDGVVDCVDKSAMNVDESHSDHIEVRNCHVAGWSSNAIYAAGFGRIRPPGNTDGGGGTIAFRDCYFANNNVAHLRLAADGTVVENCVFHNTGDVPPLPESNGGVENVVNSRGIYTGYGDPEQHIHVRDSDFELTEANTCDGSYNVCAASAVISDDHDTYGELTNVHLHGSCEVVGDAVGDHVIVDSGVGSDPDLTPPDCAPATPAEAAGNAACGGGSVQEVAEDFGHADVPGTYSLDTGAFTTSTARSTTGDRSLLVDDDADGPSIVLRSDMEARSGNTYELDVYHRSAGDADMGFLFGARPGATGWGDYTGYFGFFDSNADEIRLDYWENGSQAASQATALSWPLDEWLTVELDYRDGDAGTITMTVSDAAGTELGSVSLAHTARDGGAVGWYNYHATSDWYADSWFPAEGGTVLEDFGHADVAGTYDLDTGAFTTSTAQSTTGDHSLLVDDDADGPRIILRDDRAATAGNTYGLDVYHRSAGDADVGFLFGAQDGVTGWGDYTGYFGFFDSNADEIRLDYLEGGSWVAQRATALSWPLDEWLTVELDYRETDAGTITMTVFDAAGTELGSVSLAHTAHDDGAIGWYNYHAASDWYADSWRLL